MTFTLSAWALRCRCRADKDFIDISFIMFSLTATACVKDLVYRGVTLKLKEVKIVVKDCRKRRKTRWVTTSSASKLFSGKVHKHFQFIELRVFHYAFFFINFIADSSISARQTLKRTATGTGRSGRRQGGRGRGSDDNRSGWRSGNASPHGRRPPWCRQHRGRRLPAAIQVWFCE